MDEKKATTKRKSQPPKESCAVEESSVCEVVKPSEIKEIYLIKLTVSIADEFLKKVKTTTCAVLY